MPLKTTINFTKGHGNMCVQTTRRCSATKSTKPPQDTQITQQHRMTKCHPKLSDGTVHVKSPRTQNMKPKK
ncbi:hypothetical protein AALO_G00196490 [Alosa alosa]|uniref:Uncharacterized protein n=1 Tax=Alosa alosa TaxID=278164 RepID=A0AAV6G1F2_9TELE|nr:hypothetical protein AALO_G00196490 [Alosa alosa]